MANPYQRIWGGKGELPLPRYEVTLLSVLRGILPRGRRYLFRQAAERTLDSHATLRWGSERRGFRRLIHPNGVCLTGVWEITEETGYSGYFRKGSRALVVGRYSTCCTGQLYEIAELGKRDAEPTRTPRFMRLLVSRGRGATTGMIPRPRPA
jgi:hypothetical protein